MDDPFNLQPMMDNISRFFAEESSRPAGQLVYDDVFNVDLFAPLQRKRELSRMLSLAREYSPRVVYEIGTCDGGGLYHWCKSVPGVRRVIASEIRGTPYSEHFEKAFPEIDFLWIQESSYSPESVDKIQAWLRGGKIDVTFIDGDKAWFETDFDVVLPFMNSPSVVFMHDITDPAPGAAFRSVVGRGYDHLEVIDTLDSQEAVARGKQGIPPANGHEGWLRHWKGQSCGVGVIRIP